MTEYYERTLPLVRKGGGHRLRQHAVGRRGGGPEGEGTPIRAGIRALNAKIAGDARVDAVLLPVGDGMMVARRVR